MREEHGVDLATLTTMRVGGPAARLVRVDTTDELVDAVHEVDDADEPLLVLGGGSNLVIADEGFPGTVVRVETTGIQVESDDRCGGANVRVAAGELDRLRLRHGRPLHAGDHAGIARDRHDERRCARRAARPALRHLRRDGRPPAAVADGCRTRVGTILLGVGIGAAALGISQGPVWGWSDPRTVFTLTAAALSSVVAVRRSFRHERPAIETRLWRSRRFATANLASLLYGAALFPWMLVGVLFLVTIWGDRRSRPAWR